MSYESVTQLDIVFDTYPEENLKAQTLQCRGTGSRTKVDGRTPIPKRNWNSDILKNVTQPQHSWAMGKRVHGLLGRQHQISQNSWLPSPWTFEQLNNDIHVQRLECMVVITYSKSFGSSRVDEGRHHLFSNGTKSLDNLPPTQAALIQHIKGALLQASFCWNQATFVKQDIPEFKA